jgi:hypothetical protein
VSDIYKYSSNFEVYGFHNPCGLFIYLNVVDNCVLIFLGPTPNVDIVLSICLQSDFPTSQSGKAGIPSQLTGGPAPATSELSGSSKSHPVQSGLSHKQTGRKQYGKRKELDSTLMLTFSFAVYFWITWRRNSMHSCSENISVC